VIVRLPSLLCPVFPGLASQFRACLDAGCVGTLALDVRAACDTLGKEMALRNIELVYGGGNLGIMGAIATAVHKHGGKVIGVIPRVS
jgi:predicted Rossmann-fold nucleotide-binding protein